MKLFHLITTIEQGGAETHLLYLLSELARRGHKIELGYLKGIPHLKQKFEDFGIKTHCFSMENGRIKTFFRLLGFFKKRRFDFVHTHLIHADWLGIPAAFLAGKKCISSKHNDDEFRKSFFVRVIEQMTARMCSRVVCLSDAVLHFMADIEGIPAKKLDRIYYGYCSAEKNIPNLRKEYNLSDKTVIIGTVGRLTQQKGQRYLIEAFSKVQKTYPDSRLIIIGKGELESELKDYSKECKVDKKVIFTGFRQDAAECIGDFDMFVFPSLFEGFGMVLLEAFSRKIPIIASNVSAIPEVLDYGKAGVLVKAKSSDLLSDAIIRMIENPDLRLQFAQQGYVRYKNFFTITAMADAWEKLYTECTGEK